jgi:O-antigen/teichoic acid export membrane protein
MGANAGRLIASGPMGDAIRLGLRLVGARAMSVVTLIVAALFVEVEAFAEFGVYQVLAALVWTATFLRYDAAIVAASSEREAQAAFRLSLGVGSSVWLISTVAALTAGAAGWVPFALALLFPLSLLTRLVMRLAFGATTRDGNFKEIGRASLVQSVFQPLTLVALIAWGADGALCFAVADVVGHAVGAAYLTWHKRRFIGSIRGGWSRVELLRTAREWKSLPLYNLPGSFLSLAFISSPLLIMPMISDPSYAGHVALAFRIFDVPTQIITAASTPIFLNRLRPAEVGRSRVFRRRILLGLAVLLALVYASVAGALALADDYVLQGTALGNLGSIVAVVAAFQLFVALSTPLNDSCSLYPQQRRLLAINGLAILGSIACLMAADIVSARTILIALALLSACRVVALSELLRMLSRLNRFKSPPVAEVSAP